MPNINLLPNILIINQGGIALSGDCKSLFLNGVHILDDDENNEMPINDIAIGISKSVDEEIIYKDLSQLTLAKYIAEKNNKTDVLESLIAAGETEFDDWIEGYSAEDVINSIAFAEFPDEDSDPIMDKIIDDYLECSGVSCINPDCKSTDCEGGNMETDDGHCAQNIVCTECGSEWRDIYALTDVTEVVIANEQESH